MIYVLLYCIVLLTAILWLMFHSVLFSVIILNFMFDYVLFSIVTSSCLFHFVTSFHGEALLRYVLGLLHMFDQADPPRASRFLACRSLHFSAPHVGVGSHLGRSRISYR
jgi:hypothetical protein